MSTIKTETLSTPSNATVPVDTVVNGTAKAWVNFNGSGTVAIRRAFNVASITDNGNGDYTVNFTTAMPDANYSAMVAGSRYVTTPNWYVPFTACHDDAVLANSCRIQSNVWNAYPANLQDIPLIMVAIFS